MNPTVEDLEELLEDAARNCLRVIVNRKLNHGQYKLLAKFVFGLMNQRSRLRNRVKRRGKGQLDKVLKYIGRVVDALLEADP